MPLETLVNWPKTLSEGKQFSPPYFEDQTLTGMATTLSTLPLGKMSDGTLLLDFQSDKTNLGRKLKWDTAVEKIEKKIEFSYLVSRRQWKKDIGAI